MAQRTVGTTLRNLDFFIDTNKAKVEQKNQLGESSDSLGNAGSQITVDSPRSSYVLKT